MRVFGCQEVKAQDVEEGAARVKIRWLVTKDVGAENSAMRLFEVESGGYTPLHTHPWEHEAFILEGQGLVVGGAEERVFRKGDVVFIPSNEVHQFKNTSENAVKFLCMIPYRDR
jgi:quercetin dioxygenase-like cupin family protein